MATRDEVNACNERFGRALAAQDLDTVVAAYTDDARLLFHGAPMIRGRAAIAAAFEHALAGQPSELTFEAGEIWEAGDLVIDVGTYRKKGGTGKYVVVYERQDDGSLRMAVDAANDDA